MEMIDKIEKLLDEKVRPSLHAHGGDVVMNMARGKVIYENGAFLTLDLEDIRAQLEGYALPRIFG